MSGAHDYSPPPDQVHADEAVKGNRTSRWALRGSVLFSTLALAVSILSYSDQRGVNEDQRRALDEARAERKAEYASSVAWWLDGNDSYVIYIQNRSNVPISDVRLRYRATAAGQDPARYEELPIHDGPPYVHMDLIPPCTLMIADQEAVQEDLLGPYSDRPNEFGMLSMDWARIDFTDARGRWSMTSGGEPESVDDDFPALSADSGIQLIPYIRHVTERPIDGCGN